jgi:hypothetical protein
VDSEGVLVVEVPSVVWARLDAYFWRLVILLDVGFRTVYLDVTRACAGRVVLAQVRVEAGTAEGAIEVFGKTYGAWAGFEQQ